MRIFTKVNKEADCICLICKEQIQDDEEYTLVAKEETRDKYTCEADFVHIKCLSLSRIVDRAIF